MRIIVRTSKLAIWSRRLGSFSVAVLMLAIVLNLAGQLNPEAFEVTIALVSGFAALAVLLAIGAFVVLWQTGDKGWGLAGFGLFSGTLALGPAILLAILYISYPATIDIATDTANPPALALAHPTRDTNAHDEEAVSRRFPNLVTRHYQVPPHVLHNLTQVLVRESGWTFLRSRPPTETGQIATLNARRDTLWGWSSEIAIRIEGDPEGASVSIRAASLRDQWHDFGDNGRAAENALLALDEAVTIYVRDGLAIIDDDDDIPEVMTDEEDAL